MDLSKLSDADLLALKEKNYSKLSDEALSTLSKKPEKERGVLDTAVNVLDYTSGLTRLGLGNLIEARSGENLNLPNLKDVLTLKESVPTTADMMKTGGVLKDSPISRNVLGFVGDVALDPVNLLTLGGAGAAKAGLSKTAAGLQKASKAAEYANPAGMLIGKGMQKLGKPIYKSGLLAIDQEAARYGKEPVSDLLFEKGVKGNAQAIQKQMDEIGESLLTERNELLKKATRAGGEVSMKDAMSDAQRKVIEMRASRDPKLQPVADALQAEIDKYTRLDATPAQQYIGELPVPADFSPSYTELTYNPPVENLVSLPKQQALSEVGMPVPMQELGYYVEPGSFVPGKTVPEAFTAKPAEKFIDWTEATLGPTPIQGSQFKTTASLDIPDSAWRDGVSTSAYGAQKSLRGGLQKATEESVGRSLGPEAQAELIKKNYDLGQILTTKEKQMMEAFKEARKPGFSSVDAMIAGGSAQNPEMSIPMLALKKGRELLVRPRQTTNIGLALDKYGDTPSANAFWRQLLLGTSDPFVNRGEE